MHTILTPIKKMQHAPTLALVSVLALTAIHATAQPCDTPMKTNLISLSANASDIVTNDEINASLYIEAQSNNAKQLTQTLTQTMNQAIAISKPYPSVNVATGNQNSYPRYNDKQKIIGWTGRASLHLKSTDMAAASNLIAQLQDILMVENISFSVSDKLKEHVENRLMITASTKFQDQAKALLPVWQAKSYQLVNLTFSKQGYRPEMPMRYEMKAVSMAADAAPVPNFASGNSTISVNANGTIQLTP